MKSLTLPSATTLLTADEFMRLGDEVHGELVRGVLCEMPQPGMRHGQLAMRLGAQLLSHVEARQLGTVFAEVGALLERGPDTVRAPGAARLRPPAQAPVRGLTPSSWHLEKREDSTEAL